MKPTNNKNRLSQNIKTRFKRFISLFFSQHLQACIFSLGQYNKYALSNILTTAVIGISLALPTSFYLLLDNVRSVSTNWEYSLQITLFLKPEISYETATELSNKLTADPTIGETIIINRDDALAEYQRLSGFAAVLNELDENPLPHVILVKPRLQDIDEAKAIALSKELESLAEVDSAQYDSQWIKRLLTLLDIINHIILILSTLLAIAVLLIIGNTIRLAIHNHRTEIEILKLFGGTDRFIQRPFLYSGFWYGVFGSIIAWLLIIIAMQILQSPVKRLANLYASDFVLIGAGFHNFLILLMIGVALGLTGSWIAVKRHLKSIEPV